MKTLAVIVALISVPAFAVDYSPWPARDPEPISLPWLQLAQQGQKCCKHCSNGKPCGNSCIAASSKCKQPPGCAC
jgi:hypothetical protein